MPVICRAAWWQKPSRYFSNPEFRTHVSDSNRITACTTSTYNLPAIILSASSLNNIFYICPHYPRALQRFHSTAGQSSSVDDSPPPKYRNEETVVSDVPYAEKTRSICSSISSTTNLCRFLSVPHRHITEVGCVQLRASCKKMSHWGHRGWGWFPYSTMSILFRGCWWSNCTQRFFCEDAFPRNPLIGHLNWARIDGKDTLYCAVVLSLSHLYLSPPPPLGGAVGWPCHAQLCVATADRPW